MSKGIFTWQLIKKKKEKKNTWNDDHHDIVKILSNTDVFEYIQLKLQ